MAIKIVSVLLVLTAITICTSIPAAAEPFDMSLPNPLNLETKTLGGKQYWRDEHLDLNWRIQRNVLSGHYRLLDGDNVRRAWGTYAHCLQRLEDIKVEQDLPAMKGRAVVLLHGLGRTRQSMQPLADNLALADYRVFCVGYASLYGSHDDHAAALAKIIEGLDGIDEINLIGHSMGNIVIRRYLAAYGDAESGALPDARIRRIVMLAPPNQGAAEAKQLLALDATGQIAGKAARQLGPEWETFREKLVAPSVDFGILAGGRGDAHGFNRLIQGDDDLVIPVSTTRLSGARDFRTVPVIHTLIMNDPTVQRMTRSFLKAGHFESEEDRQPID